MNAPHNSYVADNFQRMIDAFKDDEWKAVWDGDPNRGYTSASQALHDAAKKANDDGNYPLGTLLSLLAEACSMMLVPDKPSDPFHPIWVGGGRRSTIPDDFTDSEIGFFAEVAESIENPLLKARLADLVWVRNKSLGVKYALNAIDSYIQLPIDVDTWFGDGEQCWQRAIGLSRMVKAAAGDRLDQIETSIVGVLETATVEDEFLSYRLAETLISNGMGKGHSSTIAAKLESLAREFDANGEYHSSESFYGAAAKWFALSGDDNKFVDMTVAEAEAHVSEATARVTSENSGYGVAASFLESAVQIYRSVPRAHRDRHHVDHRIQELRLRLTEYGKRALDDMATVSGPEIDLGDSVQRARDAVNGKPVHEALRAFANLHSINVTRLRESAIATLSRSPLLASIPKVVSSPDGRVIARTPGISGSVPSNSDEAEIGAEMNRSHYQPLVSIAVQALILPALEVLTSKPLVLVCVRG